MNVLMCKHIFSTLSYSIRNEWGTVRRTLCVLIFRLELLKRLRVDINIITNRDTIITIIMLLLCTPLENENI